MYDAVERSCMRKIYLRLLPFAVVCYLLAYIDRINASFAARMAAPGRVALLSQSGAICTSILDWAAEKHIGFSSFVSVGSMIDVDFADLIDYFAEKSL